MKPTAIEFQRAMKIFIVQIEKWTGEHWGLFTFSCSKEEIDAATLALNTRLIELVNQILDYGTLWHDKIIDSIIADMESVFEEYSDYGAGSESRYFLTDQLCEFLNQGYVP